MAEAPGSARVARWTGVLGIAIPLVGLVVYPIWSFPGTQTPGSDIASWANAHHSRLVVMMLFYTVGVTLWLVFGAAVWGYLRGQVSAGSCIPTCFGAGLVGYVTLLLAGFSAFDLLLYRRHGAEITSLLYDFTFALLAMSGMPTVVSLVSFAVAVTVHRVLPVGTAYLAAVVAAAHVLLLAAFIVDEGPLSLEGFSITGIPALLWAWILVTALAMPRVVRDE